MTSQLTALSEIQDLVEEFSRSLLQIEAERSGGRDSDPDLVNAAFRSIHTLKGIVSMVEVGQLVALSHELENCLDDIRLGKRALDASSLDLLFAAVDLYTASLAHAVEPSRAVPDVTSFLSRIKDTGAARPATRSAEEQVSLDWLHEDVRSVLTEYEEFRLRENIGGGRGIYSIHVSFDLMDVDGGIERLKSKLKKLGEVLTYLPSADASREDRIDLDILVGSGEGLEVLRASLTGETASIERLNTGGRSPGRDEGVPVVRGHESTRPDDVAITDGGSGKRRAPPSATPREVGSVASSVGLPGAGSAGSAPGSEGVEEPPQSIRSVVQTVRVELSRLDALMNLVGELRVIQGDFTRTIARAENTLRGVPEVRTLHVQTRQMARRIDELRDRILDVRMVPVGQMFDTLARVVRKLSREHGKEVRLVVSGEQTELDKLIVEELSDPLMHMIRNAIDHGIESVERRSAAGKSLTGKITLVARQRGNSVEIRVEDDGQGMDWLALRERAVSRGLVSREEAEVMTSIEALRLIFAPGFSTLDDLSRSSGRGVGMDVVKTNIMRLSGQIDVESEVGKGTLFRLTLPVTLAIIQALVIEGGGQMFCVPLGSVLESLMFERSEIETIEGFEVISLRSEALPIVYLDRIFDLPRKPGDGQLYVIVVGLAEHRVGLVVDDLLEQKDVVIKSLGPGLDAVPGVAGATEIGAGKTVLLLDLAAIVSDAVRDFGTGDRRRVEGMRA